jgi:hypothetical protein
VRETGARNLSVRCGGESDRSENALQNTEVTRRFPKWAAEDGSNCQTRMRHNGSPLCEFYSGLRITVVERARVVRRFSAAFRLILRVRAGFSRWHSLQFDYTNT